MKILRNFRSYFLRGMAALLPTILSIWLFVQFFKFISENVSRHINTAIVKLIMLISDDYTQEFLESFWVYGKGQIIGFIIPLIAVCIIGAILASVVGKTIWRAIDKALHKVPILKKVYPYLKQITDFALSEDKVAFKKVVAVEYPRKGIWALGLVTGSGMRKFSEAVKPDGEYLTVFVPTSPTPFTGYVIIINRDEAIDLDITIEEALRFTISGGVITPSAWNVMQGDKAL